MRFGQYKDGPMHPICQLAERFPLQGVDVQIVSDGLHQTSLEEDHLYCSGGQGGPG